MLANIVTTPRGGARAFADGDSVSPFAVQPGETSFFGVLTSTLRRPGPAQSRVATSMRPRTARLIEILFYRFLKSHEKVVFEEQ